MKVQKRHSAIGQGMRNVRAIWMAWKRFANRYVLKPENAKKIAVCMIVFAVVMIMWMTGRISNSQNTVERFTFSITSFLYALLLVMSVYLLVLIHKKSKAITHDRTLLATSDAPPHNTELVLHFILPADRRDTVLGDLEEHYGVMLIRFDKKKADAWYRFQAAGLIFPSFVWLYNHVRLWVISTGLIWLVKHLTPSLLPAVQQRLDRFTSH